MTERSVFAAVGDARRRELLSHLVSTAAQSENPQSITQIAAAIGMERTTVSRHLAFLRECSVLDVRARRPERLYFIRADPFGELEDWTLDLCARIGQQSSPAPEFEGPPGASNRGKAD